MPATATQTTLDPAAIESEIGNLEARRDRLRDKLGEIEDDLDAARSALREADSEEEQDEALDAAQELQVRHDTIEEALTEVETDLEMLRGDLADAEAAQEKEERLEALAELGREAVDRREEYEEVRDELIEVLEERAPELARRFSAWLDAAETFRSSLVKVESHAYERPSSTTDADRERADELVAELKERGVDRFKDALAPFRTSIPARRWRGWSHENGYSGPEGQLKSAVEEIRAFGNESTQSDE